MAVRDMKLSVGSTQIDWGYTWAYPDGDAEDLYEIPIYNMKLTGTDNDGNSKTYTFNVFRFGVKKQGSANAHVVGLSDEQSYQSDNYNPDYNPHSAPSQEKGAWHVYDNFLVHDGPDDPKDRNEPFATIGCIELCGPGKFDELNDKIIELSGLTSGTRNQKLTQIGSSQKLKIYYEQANRPPLKPVPPV